MRPRSVYRSGRFRSGRKEIQLRLAEKGDYLKKKSWSDMFNCDLVDYYPPSSDRNSIIASGEMCKGKVHIREFLTMEELKQSLFIANVLPKHISCATKL